MHDHLCIPPPCPVSAQKHTHLCVCAGLQQKIADRKSKSLCVELDDLRDVSVLLLLLVVVCKAGFWASLLRWW